MAFSWAQLNYPVILCPPMDGITDSAFRELIADMGGSSALYCEFINVKGLIFQNPKTLFELKYTEKQRPIIAQLFGNNPEDFYEASKMVVKMGFDSIDVNMGCPAHKVASKGGGCALMGNTENAAEIVRQTIKGANEAAKELNLGHEIEVTCKMRLGISDTDTVMHHGLSMIEAGAKCIAIHGRTLKQMYTGEAKWEPIKDFIKIKNERYGNSIKVFGSGDVKSLWEAFIRILNIGVDGVMIGRGSFGNPWVFEKSRVDMMKKYILEIESFYNKKSGNITIDEIEKYPNYLEIKNNLENKEHTFEETSEMAIRHAKLMFQEKGDSGIIQMRKHLAWYFHSFDGAKDLRSKLVRVTSVDEIEGIIKEFVK